jgi:hypothetical protein
MIGPLRREIASAQCSLTQRPPSRRGVGWRGAAWGGVGRS